MKPKLHVLVCALGILLLGCSGAPRTQLAGHGKATTPAAAPSGTAGIPYCRTGLRLIPSRITILNPDTIAGFAVGNLGRETCKIGGYPNSVQLTDVAGARIDVSVYNGNTQFGTAGEAAGVYVLHPGYALSWNMQATISAAKSGCWNAVRVSLVLPHSRTSIASVTSANGQPWVGCSSELRVASFYPAVFPLRYSGLPGY